MSDDQKQKSNWRLLLKRVFWGSVIIVGVFWISASDFDQAKNLKWEDWTTRSLVNASAVIAEESGQPVSKNNQTSSEEKTWDYWLKYWVELVGTLAIPLLIFGFGLWFQEREREKAQDNLFEEAIQDYLKSMANILLDERHTEKLFPANNQSNSSDEDDNKNSVHNVVRALTIVILRRLEGDVERQVRIIQFLRDTGLFKFILNNAHLSKINLFRASLKRFYLKGVHLKGSHLKEAHLEKAHLEKAHLEETNLEGAHLEKAHLEGANLEGANLEGACLSEALNLTSEQIKLACNWEKAIYKEDESENRKYIEELKKDKSSDPTKTPDCSKWNN